MNQTTRMVGNQIQVVLSGNICLDVAAEMRGTYTYFMNRGQKSFLFDFSEVGHIDRAALGMLVFISNQAELNDGSVIMIGLRGLVKDSYIFNRLTTAFEIQS